MFALGTPTGYDSVDSPTEGKLLRRRKRLQTRDAVVEELLVSLVEDEPADEAADDDQQEEYVNMTAREAISKLMGYLKIDPDGGLVNLEDDQQDWGTSQVSKIHILVHKDGLHLLLAYFVMFRLAINVPSVLYVSASTIFCYYSPRCEAHLDDGLSSRCQFDLAVCALLVAIFEILRGGACLWTAFWNLFRFICAREEQVAGQIVHQRYIFLSRFFLEDLQRLQNMSALQCLGYVHPALLSQYAKDLKGRDHAAKALFERILGVQEYHLTDLVLHKRIIRIIMHSKEKLEVTPDEKKDEAVRLLRLSSYALFQRLAKVKELPESNRIRDPLALRHRGWMVRAVAYLESSYYWSYVLLQFAFGSMAFLVKVVRLAVTLLDAEASILLLLLKTVSLINQVMGTVSVLPLLRWRVFRFIFGGQDSYVSTEEVYLMETYLALLVERIWTSSSASFTWCRKMLTLATLDDNDIQSLVLEETDPEKECVIRAVKKTMANSEACCFFEAWGTAMAGRICQWISL